MEEDKKDAIKNIELISEDIKEYFVNSYIELDKDLDKLDEYMDIIDTQIVGLSANIYSKGAQRYLIEHMRNASTFLSQKQSIKKDLVGIQRLIIDYSIKHESSKSGEDLMAQIMTELSRKRLEDRDRVIDPVIYENVDIDSEIDDILNEAIEEDE